jgi:hypothetical protein
MSDRATRSAVLWATAIALPVTLGAAILIFSTLSAGSSAAPRPAPAASTSTPSVRPVPDTPVPMDAPVLSARAASVCKAVLARLPVAVRDLARRTVGNGPAQNAAYGEPALTMSCGVAQPALCPSLEQTRPDCVPLDTELLTMDRVCWYAERGAAANTFTTMDREIPIRVTVPAPYEQPAQWANEFSAAVIAADAPSATGVPSGCA